jgi:hypothetical protein
MVLSGAGFSLWGLVAKTSRLGTTKPHRLKPAPQKSRANLQFNLRLRPLLRLHTC